MKEEANRGQKSEVGGQEKEDWKDGVTWRWFFVEREIILEKPS
jgi:hypothetical protein